MSEISGRKEPQSIDRFLPVRIMQPAGVVFSSLFLFGWLLPILYVGIAKQDVNYRAWLMQAGISRQTAFTIHNYLNDNYRIACLFTRRVASWSNYYFQVQLQGSAVWHTVDEQDYARMKPFGHRTRLRRMLSRAGRSSSGERRKRAICRFIKQRHEALYPAQGPVRAVRIVRVTYPSGSEIARPAGHWVVPPLDTIPVARQRIDSTFAF